MMIHGFIDDDANKSCVYISHRRFANARNALLIVPQFSDVIATINALSVK